MNKQNKKQYPTTLTTEQVGKLHKAYEKATGTHPWAITTGKALRYAVEKFIEGNK